MYKKSYEIMDVTKIKSNNDNIKVGGSFQVNSHTLKYTSFCVS